MLGGALLASEAAPADELAFDIFSVSFCELICNQCHQAAAIDAGG